MCHLETNLLKQKAAASFTIKTTLFCVEHNDIPVKRHKLYIQDLTSSSPVSDS